MIRGRERFQCCRGTSFSYTCSAISLVDMMQLMMYDEPEDLDGKSPCTRAKAQTMSKRLCRE